MEQPPQKIQIGKNTYQFIKREKQREKYGTRYLSQYKRDNGMYEFFSDEFLQDTNNYKVI